MEGEAWPRDSLTGLGMRGEAFSRLRLDLARGTAGAVIFCDLDDFAAFNYVTGHARGDELLRLVAAELAPLSEHRPRPDGREAYRLSGDEFLVRLPCADLPTAEAFAEETRLKIKQLAASLLAPSHAGLPLTATFAVAAWKPGQALSDVMLLLEAERILADPAIRDAVVSIVAPEAT